MFSSIYGTFPGHCPDMMALNSYFENWAVIPRISNRKVDFLVARQTSDTTSKSKSG